MQLQFSKSAIRCLGTALQDVRTAETTQELRIPEGMPDIGRILTTWGQIQLRSKEWQGRNILVTGGVMTWTLYAPEDGTEPRSVESWLPFQIRWEVTDNDREGVLRAMPMLRFADSRSLSSRKMMVRAGVAVQIQGTVPMELEISSPGELPEDVQVLTNIYPVRMAVENGEKTFLVDEELMLADNGFPAEKLLGIVATPEVNENKVLTNRIVFKGKLNVHLVYRDTEGKVHSNNLPVTFSQLTELDRDHSADAQVDIRMAVTSLEADIDQGKIRFKCGLVGQYLIDDRHVLELAQDAYSPHRAVQAEAGILRLPVILDDRAEYMTAEQTVLGQHGHTADMVFLPDYPSVRQTEDTIEVALPGLFQGVVYDENDSLQGISCRWESKLSLAAHENSRIQTAVTGGDVQPMTSGDGMILSAPLSVELRTVADQEITMVHVLELGELQEPDPNRPSLILRKAGKESLWELAKRTGSTVAGIIAANGLSGEPLEEQMLLIPVV